MLVNELKCIEVLMRYLINNDINLETEILSKFEDEESFDKYKANLFNLISINSLVTNFNDNPSFSLQAFLETGIIPKLYPDRTVVPSTASTEYGNYKSFYQSLISALKSNNYIFDEDNNIFISNSELEATIPQIWLYRLSQAIKKDKYERVFLYNRNRPSRINNKQELLEYLRTTKSFLVQLSTSNPNAEYDVAFAVAQAKVNHDLKGKRAIKVDDIIDLFKASVPERYNVETSKYRMNEEFWIIRQAEQMGTQFYGESISVQEAYLNKWITSRIECNTKAAEEAQKYILLASTKRIRGFKISDLNKDAIIAGLFSLYVQIIESLEQDLSSVSLSDFKIKAYMDEQTQSNVVDRRTLDRQINSQDQKIEEAVNEAVRIFEEIRRLDLIENFDRINELRARYDDLTEEIEAYKNSKKRLDTERKSLNDIESLAFDNDRIMSLINDSTINGQVYVESQNLVSELHNKDISDPVFKATINVNRLLNFIEDINLTLEEFGYSMK